MEVGPFRLQSSATELQLNNGSWHKHANLLFLDQPVGTGFATTDTDAYRTELPQMANDVLKFLETYFKVFPERQKDEFYLAGESYAGQYIPYIARAILDRNLNKTSTFMSLMSEDDVKRDQPDQQQPAPNTVPAINLKAVLIGNGWIDPVSQYLSYLPYAYESGLITPNTTPASHTQSAHRRCRAFYESTPSARFAISLAPCESVLSTLLRSLYEESGYSHNDASACVNIYDVRLRDRFSACGMNWPPDLEHVTPYLRRKEVLQALHVPTTSGWKECSGPVGARFKARRSRPAVGILPTLVEDGVQVVMFNGDKDLVCNHIGNELLIKSLAWGKEADGKEQKRRDSGEEGVAVVTEFTSLHNTGFRATEPSQEWYVGGTAAGTIQAGRNLTYIRVYNASHMVPFDVPDVAQAMAFHVLGIPGYSVEDLVEKKVQQEKEEQKEEGKEEKKTRPHIYYKAGAFVLAVCIIASLFLALFVWRNRRLAQTVRPRAGGHQRVRSVHYEDEPGDAGQTAGFLQSVLAGMSRWRVPDGVRKGGVLRGILKRSTGSYRQLDNDDGLIVDIPLQTLRRASDELDSLPSTPEELETARSSLDSEVDEIEGPEGLIRPAALV